MTVARSAAAGSCVTIKMVFLNSCVELLEERQDVVRALAIEIAGGLVGDDDLRVVHDGARDRDALLLPAGELPRVVAHAVFEADDAERGLRARFVARPETLREEERQLHVLDRGEHGHQVVGLEDEADGVRRGNSRASPSLI